MAAETSDWVREIAEARGLSESEVFERALERGIEDLWEDLVLAQSLDGCLEREESVERVSRTKVERAEREHEVVERGVLDAGRTVSARTNSTGDWTRSL